MASQRRTAEHWRRLVEGWPASGLTQAQYCERHGISIASLHRWRERLAGERRSVAVPERRRAAPDAVQLVPVQLRGEPAMGQRCTQVRIVFPDGVRVELSAGVDAATLREVMALLRECPAA
jgi:hypothetical protein